MFPNSKCLLVLLLTKPSACCSPWFCCSWGMMDSVILSHHRHPWDSGCLFLRWHPLFSRPIIFLFVCFFLFLCFLSLSSKTRVEVPEEEYMGDKFCEIFQDLSFERVVTLRGKSLSLRVWKALLLQAQYCCGDIRHHSNSCCFQRQLFPPLWILVLYTALSLCNEIPF